MRIIAGFLMTLMLAGAIGYLTLKDQGKTALNGGSIKHNREQSTNRMASSPVRPENGGKLSRNTSSMSKRVKRSKNTERSDAIRRASRRGNMKSDNPTPKVNQDDVTKLRRETDRLFNELKSSEGKRGKPDLKPLISKTEMAKDESKDETTAKETEKDNPQPEEPSFEEISQVYRESLQKLDAILR
ncbi:hypothetical protein DRN32_03075 [Thermococci archaeon]|nr:MAG: hypothetical protein DRN32_03075 [Thermococci archaeon]HDO75292.1 hypothetical protein [Candidatus Poribacteria bacterium]HEX28897.1 hypothetical protein [Candidatus Poribacteria bacterium]